MKRFALYVSVAIAALALGMLMNFAFTPSARTVGESQVGVLQRGTALLGQERPIGDFTLTAEDGSAFTNARLKGKWTYLFFGYTLCPDICPVTLQVMGEALQVLERRGADQDVQALFVSVDPERDDLAKLREYVHYFHPRMLGATGEAEAIAKLARGLGIVYQKVANPAEPANYLVDHSAQVLLINPRGELAAVLTPPHEAALLADDLLRLRALVEKKT